MRWNWISYSSPVSGDGSVNPRLSVVIIPSNSLGSEDFFLVITFGTKLLSFVSLAFNPPLYIDLNLAMALANNLGLSHTNIS